MLTRPRSTRARLPVRGGEARTDLLERRREARIPDGKIARTPEHLLRAVVKALAHEVVHPPDHPRRLGVTRVPVGELQDGIQDRLLFGPTLPIRPP